MLNLEQIAERIEHPQRCSKDVYLMIPTAPDSSISSSKKLVVV
jgi:hypothetical protein